MRKTLVVIVAFALVSVVHAGPRNVLLDTFGFNDVEEITGIPGLLKGPIVVTTIQWSDEEPRHSDQGVVSGRWGVDRIEWFGESILITSAWHGKHPRLGETLIFCGANHYFFLRSASDNVEERFILEVYYLSSDESVTCLVK